ncbi:MAG: PAS domain-containing protein [Bdellovibrionales bacterium]|nr:PAS domain-containing protein [Bdellovibrionales bacterium]
MSSSSSSERSDLGSLSADQLVSLWTTAGSLLSMGLVVFAADGKRFVADKRARALFGVVADGEQATLAFRDWLGCESIEFFDRLQIALADDEALDEVITPKSRSNCWIRMVGAPRGDASERGFLVWDRTVQVENESRLQGDRHFFETVLNSFSDPVTITDSDLKFIYGNTAFSSLIGLIPEEYVGRSMRAIGLKSSDGFELRDRQCLDRHIEVEAEEALHFESSDSAVDSWLVKRVPYSAPSGKTTVVSVFRDIREVRRMQNELDRSRARASQMARLKGLATLAAGVAHELNNPLMIAAGSLEALSDLGSGQLDEKRTEVLLTRAARGIQRASDIVQAMRKMGNSSSDDMQIPIGVTAVVESVRLLLSADLSRFGVELRSSLPQDLVVVGSEPKLIRAIAAIVQNSIEVIARMSSESTKLVLVEKVADALSGDTGECVLSIEDSGTGVDSQHEDKLFEPFFSTKDIGQGLGLGLALAKESIESMSGRVEYTGKGRLGGARFLVTLKIP